MPTIQLTDQQLSDLRALAARGRNDLAEYMSDGDMTADGYTADEITALQSLQCRSATVVNVFEGDAIQVENTTSSPSGSSGFVVHFNEDYHEWLSVHHSLGDAVAEMRKALEVEAAIDDPEFFDEVTEAYESANWKGLAVYEIDLCDKTSRVISPEEVQAMAETGS